MVLYIRESEVIHKTNYSAYEIKSESKKERQLYMDLGRGDLQNVRQMRDELKKVIYDLNNA